MEKTFYVAAYDVPSDTKRRKLADFLELYGQRVQESVFECRLDKRRLEHLKSRLAKMLDAEDKFRLYRVCQSCLSKSWIWGEGEWTEEPVDYIFGLD